MSTTERSWEEEFEEVARHCMMDMDFSYMRTFIKKLLTQDRAALIERIEGMEYEHNAPSTASVHGYNSAIDDVLKILTSQNHEKGDNGV